MGWFWLGLQGCVPVLWVANTVMGNWIYVEIKLIHWRKQTSSKARCNEVALQVCWGYTSCVNLFTQPEANSRSLYWFLKLLRDPSVRRATYSSAASLQQWLLTILNQWPAKRYLSRRVQEHATVLASVQKTHFSSLYFQKKVHMHVCATSTGTWTLKFVFLPAKKRNIYFLELSRKRMSRSVMEVEFWELSPSPSHVKLQHFKHLGGCVSKGKSSP